MTWNFRRKKAKLNWSWWDWYITVWAWDVVVSSRCWWGSPGPKIAASHFEKNAQKRSQQLLFLSYKFVKLLLFKELLKYYRKKPIQKYYKKLSYHDMIYQINYQVGKKGVTSEVSLNQKK